jgi:hypothetical protein
MRAVAFADVPAGDWDAACDASDDAWLFHRASWVEIESRYAALENHSFALVDERGVPAAVQPLYLREFGVGAFVERLVDSGVHRTAGLAVAEQARDRLPELRALAMQRVLEVAERGEADRIQLGIQNLAPRARSHEREEVPFWVLEHDFFLGLQFGLWGLAPAPGMTTCASDQIVELGASEDTLWRALHESCRRAVRKAEAAGVEFERAAAATAAAEYFDLARLSAVRTGEELPPAAYYEDVLNGLPGRAHVLLARHGGAAAAGLVVLVDKGAVHFLAGASAPDALALRVNDFLHWNAILWAKGAGHEVYRLGPTFPEVPADWPIARVSRFKAKFGGRARTIVQGSRFLRPERYAQLAEEQLRLRLPVERAAT